LIVEVPVKMLGDARGASERENLIEHVEVDTTERETERDRIQISREAEEIGCGPISNSNTN
jgi:hypothetical protein